PRRSAPKHRLPGGAIATLMPPTSPPPAMPPALRVLCVSYWPAKKRMQRHWLATSSEHIRPSLGLKPSTSPMAQTRLGPVLPLAMPSIDSPSPYIVVTHQKPCIRPRSPRPLGHRVWHHHSVPQRILASPPASPTSSWAPLIPPPNRLPPCSNSPTSTDLRPSSNTWHPWMRSCGSRVSMTRPKVSSSVIELPTSC